MFVEDFVFLQKDLLKGVVSLSPSSQPLIIQAERVSNNGVDLSSRKSFILLIE